MDVETIRIPEMIEHLALAPEDMIVIWDASENKTRKTPLSQIIQYIESPSGGTYSPVQNGDTILYIVPPDKDGQDQISIPSIAGMNFRLLRDGYPLEPDVEYTALTGGGAQLIGSRLVDGQRYELEVFELIGGGPVVVGSASGGGFIEGDVIINTNINISINDLNKLHQIRGGVNALTITLPDVDDCPKGSYLIIEALIGNTRQHLINTTGSQYIYRKNESRDDGIYIGKGDVIWFYRKTDGWYVINEKGNFDNLCSPKAAYKAGFNQLICDGSEYSRALYPKLWREIQTLGGSLVDDTTWLTPSGIVDGRTENFPYRGCFSTGDGSTTFRVPDMRNVALRGLKNDGGADSERYANIPGSFQGNTNKKFWPGTPATPVILQVDGTNTEIGVDTIGPTSPNIRVPLAIDKTAFSIESRMDNVGILWVLDY